MTKNLLVSAALIVAATIFTGFVSAILGFFIASPPHSPADALVIIPGAIFTFIGAILFGLMFSIVTLTIAGVTMPPTLALARKLGWNRPLVDVIGGAAAGWFPPVG